MNTNFSILLIAVLPVVTSCTTGRTVSFSAAMPTNETSAVATRTPHHSIPASGRADMAAMPKAVLYKTNGDWTDHVQATYNAATGRFISYPAPTDILPDSEPIQLADGWLLDRRGGIGANTVFLQWTLEQYSRMVEAPSLADLRKAIIPDARVTECVRLPMLSVAAQNDTAAVNAMIRAGLPGAEWVVRTFTAEVK